MVKISIITPFKNTSKYIGACIDSVLQQDFQEWELLCVNDHSSDNSVAMVKQYAINDSRIKLLHSKGEGIIPALRLAYKNSRGTFITRMDSDDIMPPNRLLSQYNSLISKGNGYVSVGLVKYFCDQGDVAQGFKRYEDWLNTMLINEANFSEIYKECVVPSPGFMIHRNDLDYCGAFESEHYPEDYDLAFRMYKSGFKIAPCYDLVLFWRDYGWRTSRVNENYTQEKLLDLKLHYFLEIDYDPQKTIMIWGASKKGKQVARYLVLHNIDFRWICDNQNKIGQFIYGKKLEPFEVLTNESQFQSIILVANPNDQTNIVNYMTQKQLVMGSDYYFFC